MRLRKKANEDQLKGSLNTYVLSGYIRMYESNTCVGKIYEVKGYNILDAIKNLKEFSNTSLGYSQEANNPFYLTIKDVFENIKSQCAWYDDMEFRRLLMDHGSAFYKGRPQQKFPFGNWSSYLPRDISDPSKWMLPKNS